MANPGNTYTASDIDVLRGLEPVKLRPGMYTRTDSCAHVIQEVIDNAADEALAGFARHITVTLYQDNSVAVEDDGRGIPVDMHPVEKVPAVQLVFCELHSGGKFHKQDANSVYKFSGGLHGVGVSVTNALSTRLEVDIRRGGKAYRLEFANGGEIAVPLTTVRKNESSVSGNSGTRVRVWPDAKYFESPRIPQDEIERMLRAKSVLLPGVKSVLRIEQKDGTFEERAWHYANGLSDYLGEMCNDTARIGQMFAGEGYAVGDAAESSFAEGEGAAWAICWTEDAGTLGESYVNLIPTVSGGTHESGLRTALFEALKRFAESHGLMSKGLKLTPEDCWRNVRFVLSARLLDPQFRGQVKERLDSREAHRLIVEIVKPRLESWLIANIDSARAIADLALSHARARLREGQKVERKRSAGVSQLPGKLTECASADPAECELFLVEGDSAGGSAKQARNKDNQAILPLKGKIENTWEVGGDTVLSNAEVHDIAVAIGIDPHAFAPAAGADAADAAKVLANLRYHTIAIMADADDDGLHITTLLLTLFFRHFPQVIAAGHLYIAQAPLFRIDAAAAGKSRPARKLYAMDGNELQAVLDRLGKEGYRDIRTSRFKGLGEMSREELWETTMSPDTRRLLRVELPTAEDEFGETQALFGHLMARKEAAWRRDWMSRAGYQIED